VLGWLSKKQKTNKHLQCLQTKNSKISATIQLNQTFQTEDKTRHALFSASGKQQRYELSRGQCSVAYMQTARQR
jgi:hypothetical protein